MTIDSYCPSCYNFLNEQGDIIHILDKEYTEEEMEALLYELPQKACPNCLNKTGPRPFRYMSKDIPGYYVTATGSVFSLKGKKPRRLKLNIDTEGYQSVQLYIDGKRKRFRIHRLVINKFCGSMPFDNAVIRHLDDRKHNNNILNLEWGTRAENAKDYQRNKHDRR